MSRRAKFILLALLGVVVLWFTAGAGICYTIGKSRIHAGTEQTAPAVFVTQIYESPPTDDLYSGYNLLRLAGTSPLFAAKADDLIGYHVQNMSIAAYFMGAILAGRVPIEVEEADREAWYRLIEWLDEERENIDAVLEQYNQRLDQFDDPPLGTVRDIHVLDDGRVLALREFDIDFRYLELTDASGEPLWAAQIAGSGGLELHRILALNADTLFVRVLDEDEQRPITIALSLDDGSVVWSGTPPGALDTRALYQTIPNGRASLVSGNRLYELHRIPDSQRHLLVALDSRTGELLWQAEPENVGHFPRLFLLEGFVAVDHSGGLEIFDGASGELRGSYEGDQESRCAQVSGAWYCAQNGTLNRIQPNASENRLEVSPLDLFANCPEVILPGFGGTYSGQLVFPISCRGAADDRRLALLFATLEPFTSLGISEIGSFQMMGSPYDDLMMNSPEDTPFSGSLTRFVPIKVSQGRGEDYIVVLDLEQRQIAWQSHAWEELMHWDLFSSGERYYLSSSWDEVALVNGSTGELDAAVRLHQAWTPPGPRPDYTSNEHFWVFNNDGLGRLNAGTLALEIAPEELPELEDIRAEFQDSLGFQ